MTTRILIGIISMAYINSGCQESAGTAMLKTDTLIVARVQKNWQEKPAIIKETVSTRIVSDYDDLEYQSVINLSAAPGTKSVLFNSTGTKLYAMNLEGMSVYEFDRETRKVIREFKFKATPGMGWDYARGKPINSFQEKPVEACFSHNDKFLWISLHNAEGIVPIQLDSLEENRRNGDNNTKKVYVKNRGENTRDSFYVPLITTGKTPKIIARTADSKYLLVSNWHSYNVSVLEVDATKYPFAKVIGTIPVSSIPRGIAVDDKNNRSYIAIMGGASISVVNNTVWQKVDDINVAANPRHIVMDSSGRLFVSYNSLGKIACIDGISGKTLFTTTTHAQPRTIILSKNQKFIFVTCYSSDFVDVFQINEDSFEKIASLPCKGHPVGVDIFEDEKKLEAWVCAYSKGTISVFSFRKR